MQNNPQLPKPQKYYSLAYKIIRPDKQPHRPHTSVYIRVHPWFNNSFNPCNTPHQITYHPLQAITQQPDSPLWNMFQGKDITIQKTNFKYTLSNHLGTNNYKTKYNAVNLSLPCLNIDKYDFNTLYGAGRNVYITTYLYFLYNQSKPLFSFFYQEELSRAGVLYDYKQYQKIANCDALAINALEYLTWGVEYTPYLDPGNTIKQAFAGNPVFEKYFDAICSWITWDPDKAQEAAATALHYHADFLGSGNW